MTGNPHLADGSRAVGLLGALERAAGVGAGGVLRSIRAAYPVAPRSAPARAGTSSRGSPIAAPPFHCPAHCARHGQAHASYPVEAFAGWLARSGCGGVPRCSPGPSPRPQQRAVFLGRGRKPTVTRARADTSSRAPLRRTSAPWGSVCRRHPGRVAVRLRVAAPGDRPRALLLSLIAGVYIGFAVADGRPRVIAVEGCAVAASSSVLAAAGVTATVWVLVAGYVAHGLKDFWQERRRFVANTRWWPPFCAAVDWLVATVLVVEIAAGVSLH